MTSVDHIMNKEADDPNGQQPPLPKAKAKIVTHDGTFHCDEVLACYLLREHVAQFRDGEVVRSRDVGVVSSGDVVVDVGGEYNPEAHRYDHHQRGFTVTYKGDAVEAGVRYKRTKLSSAGLIYRHFGEEIVRSVQSKHGLPACEGDGDQQRVLDHVYESFVEGVDAVDNGIDRYISSEPPNYIDETDLASRIQRMNPDWYDLNPTPDDNFLVACHVAGREFEEAVVRACKSWLPARNIIHAAYVKRDEIPNAHGRVLVLHQWAPWKDHIYEFDTDKELLYVVYQDTKKDSWRIQCVPAAKGSFESRKPLPEKWRGLRNEQLNEVTKIDNCVFVHASGFIGGNKTYEGALQLAVQAISA